LLLDPLDELVVSFFVLGGSQKLSGRKTQAGGIISSAGGVGKRGWTGSVGMTLSGGASCAQLASKASKAIVGILEAFIADPLLLGFHVRDVSLVLCRSVFLGLFVGGNVSLMRRVLGVELGVPPVDLDDCQQIIAIAPRIATSLPIIRYWEMGLSNIAPTD
jgi:hypothetical protein